jgi:hypothetical protein
MQVTDLGMQYLATGCTALAALAITDNDEVRRVTPPSPVGLTWWAADHRPQPGAHLAALRRAGCAQRGRLWPPVAGRTGAGNGQLQAAAGTVWHVCPVWLGS